LKTLPLSIAEISENMIHEVGGLLTISGLHLRRQEFLNVLGQLQCHAVTIRRPRKGVKTPT
jgi:hypothetical protein